MKLFSCVFLFCASFLAFGGIYDLSKINSVELDVKIHKEYRKDGFNILEVSFLSEHYKGTDIRVFGYYAYPANKKKPVPGLIYTAGGGYPAPLHTVIKWAKQGYACFGIHLPNGVAGKKNFSVKVPGAHEFRLKEGIEQNQIYHNIVSLIRAVTFLQSRAEVVKNKIGVTGESWGGFHSSYLAGVDPRIAAAAPVYGCGNLKLGSYWDRTFANMKKNDRKKWYSQIDPGNYYKNIKCPILFLDGTNDWAYWLDSVVASYKSIKSSDKRLSLAPMKSHALEPDMWTAREKWFAFHLKGKGKPFPKIGNVFAKVEKGRLIVEVQGTGGIPIKSAYFCYSVGEGGLWPSRVWTTIPAAKNKDVWQSEIPVAFPDRPLFLFATIKDQRNIPISCVPVKFLPKTLGMEVATTQIKSVTVFEDEELGSRKEFGRSAHDFKNKSKIKPGKGGPTCEFDYSDKHSGERSLKITLNPQCKFELKKDHYQRLGVKWVEGCEDYKISVWMKAGKPTKVTLGMEAASKTYTREFSVNGDWREYVWTVNIPKPECFKVRPFLTAQAGNGELWIDSFKITAGKSDKIALVKPATKKKLAGPLVFHCAFDGTLESSLASEGKIPLKKGKATFAKGLSGQAVINDEIQYESKENISKKKGTIMFWVSPLEDLKANQSYGIFNESPPNNPGYNKLALWIWGRGSTGLRLRFDVRDPKDSYIVSKIKPVKWHKGMWHHVTGTWDCAKGLSLYLDGELLNKRFAKWIPINHDFFTLNAKQFKFDNLKIFNKVLSPKEIKKEFDKHAFLSSMELSEAIAAKNNFPFKVKLSGIKGGKASVKLVVKDLKTGKVIKRATRNVTGNKTGVAEFFIDAGKSGLYHVVSTSQSGAAVHEQEKYVNVINPMRRSLNASELPPDLTLIDEIDLTNPEHAGRIKHNKRGKVTTSPAGTYFESGDEMLFDAIALKMRLKHPGRIHVLEIDYPDDGDREMTLSLHINNETMQNDLGGIPTGVDIPVTNKMKTYRTFFVAYPDKNGQNKDCVVLIQNWWGKHRAAAAKVRIYEVKGDLKPLLVRNKAKNPRLIGVYCEDANGFLLNIGKSSRRHGGIASVEWGKAFKYLGQIMDHSGQNLFHFPVFWYGTVHHDFKCVVPKSIREKEERYSALLSAWLMSGKHYGYKLLPNITASGQRAFPVEICKDLEGAVKKGWLQMCSETNKYARPGSNVKIRTNNYPELKFLRNEIIRCLSNPMHPKFVKLWWNMVEEIIAKNAKSPALVGLSIRLSGNYASLLCFRDLKVGYGDFTVGLYEKEKGIKIPVPADDPKCYSKRYEWLIKNRKEDWINWRCDKLTPRLIKTADYLQKMNPDLKLYLDLYLMPKQTEKEYLEMYRECGIDLKRLMAHSAIVMLKRVSPNYDRMWLIKGGKTKDGIDKRKNYSMIRKLFENNTQNQFAQGAFFYNKYHESRPKKNWKTERDMPFDWNRIGHGAGGIQDTGRRFLRGYVRELAALDAKVLMDGGWGLEILGHEKELREFSKAYLTLENANYIKVKNIDAPVTVRERKSNGKHAFYVVNESEKPVELSLKLRSSRKVKELTTDKELIPDSKGILKLELKPYSVRSFVINLDGGFWHSIKSCIGVGTSSNIIDGKVKINKKGAF
jgi:dienelactone hydrolase